MHDANIRPSFLRRTLVRHRIVSAISAASIVAVVMGGCSPADVGSDPNNPDQVEVITWWTSGAERSALYNLVAKFSNENPEMSFIDASVGGEGGANARHAIAARLEADNPPDSFQSTAGAALSEYVDQGDLQDLSDFFADNGLTEVYRPALLDLLTVDGALYSVPSDIHRVNVLWANNGLLAASGVDPSVHPANIDAWVADLEKVRRSGVEFPLVLGDDLMQVQLFENVLLADLGPDGYQSLWTDATMWEGADLLTAIDDYGRLLDYTERTDRTNDWAEACRQVVQGDAAYILVADYVLSSFQRNGFTATDYSAMPAPGTGGTFDFLADSFTLPVGAVHPEGAYAWLLTVASASGQKTLSFTKGSIPARSDTVKDDYPPYQQSAIESLALDTVVPSLAHGVAASPAWTAAIAGAVARFGDDRHPLALANALVDAARQELDRTGN
jgi:glucose/mannose transport system substrate-binding protein